MFYVQQCAYECKSCRRQVSSATAGVLQQLPTPIREKYPFFFTAEYAVSKPMFRLMTILLTNGTTQAQVALALKESRVNEYFQRWQAYLSACSLYSMLSVFCISVYSCYQYRRACVYSCFVSILIYVSVFPVSCIFSNHSENTHLNISVIYPPFPRFFDHCNGYNGNLGFCNSVLKTLYVNRQAHLNSAQQIFQASIHPSQSVCFDHQHDMPRSIGTRDATTGLQGTQFDGVFFIVNHRGEIVHHLTTQSTENCFMRAALIKVKERCDYFKIPYPEIFTTDRCCGSV